VVLNSKILSSLKLVGLMAGAAAASVIAQSLVARPAFSEDSAPCFQLTPPGPGQIAYCIEPHEETALHKEIADAQGDVRKFVTRLKLHASGTKKAYTDALKDMHPVVRNAVLKNCGAEANEGIKRLSCFKDTLDLMEQEAETYEQRFTSDTKNTGDILEAELVKQNHFIGKILFGTCGAHPTNNCFYYNLVALHEQLTNSFNAMTGAFDEMARWGVISVACDKKLGADACAKANPIKMSDFIPSNLVAFAPAFKLPGANASLKPPARVDADPKLRTYKSNRIVRTHKKKKRKSAPASVQGSGVGTQSGSGTGVNKVVAKTVAKTGAKTGAAPTSDKPAAKKVATSSTGPTGTKTVKGLPNGSAQGVPGGKSPAAVPSQTPPVTAPSSVPSSAPEPSPAPSAVPTPSPAPSASAPATLPTNPPAATVPAGTGTSSAAPQATGDFKDVPCLQADQDGYMTSMRKSRSNPANFPEILSGTQHNYACRVKANYSGNPSAVALANHGLKLAALSKGFMGDYMKLIVFHKISAPLCAQVTDEMTTLASDLGVLQMYKPTPELDALAADAQTMSALSCDELSSIGVVEATTDTDDARITQFKKDFGAWMCTINADSPGSTVGFSNMLGSCRN
jgi:hypothetical protein